MAFEKGVSYYTTGYVKLFVFFPESACVCQYCKFLWQDSIGRYWCRLTDDMVYNPKARSDRCPVILDTEKKSNGEEKE